MTHPPFSDFRAEIISSRSFSHLGSPTFPALCATLFPRGFPPFIRPPCRRLYLLGSEPSDPFSNYLSEDAFTLSFKVQRFSPDSLGHIFLFPRPRILFRLSSNRFLVVSSTQTGNHHRWGGFFFHHIRLSFLMAKTFSFLC